MSSASTQSSRASSANPSTFPPTLGTSLPSSSSGSDSRCSIIRVIPVRTSSGKLQVWSSTGGGAQDGGACNGTPGRRSAPPFLEFTSKRKGSLDSASVNDALTLGDGSWNVAILENEIAKEDLVRLTTELSSRRAQAVPSTLEEADHRESRPGEVEKLRRDKRAMADLLKQLQRDLLKKEAVIKQLKAENAKLQDTTRLLETRVSDSDDQEERIKTLTEEVETLRSQVVSRSCSSCEKSDHSQEQEDVRDQSESSNDEELLRRLIEENKRLKECVRSIYLEVKVETNGEGQSNDNLSVQCDVEELWKQKEEIKERFRELTLKVSFQEDTIQSLSEENQSLKETLESKKEDDKDDSRERELEQMVESLRDELENSQRQFEEVQIENEILRNELSKMSMQIEEYNKNTTKLIDENKLLQTSLQLSQENFESLQKEVYSWRQKYEEAEAKWEARLREITHQSTSSPSESLEAERNPPESSETVKDMSETLESAPNQSVSAGCQRTSQDDASAADSLIERISLVADEYATLREAEALFWREKERDEKNLASLERCLADVEGMLEASGRSESALRAAISALQSCKTQGTVAMLQSVLIQSYSKQLEWSEKTASSRSSSARSLSRGRSKGSKKFDDSSSYEQTALSNKILADLQDTEDDKSQAVENRCSCVRKDSSYIECECCVQEDSHNSQKDQVANYLNQQTDLDNDKASEHVISKSDVFDRHEESFRKPAPPLIDLEKEQTLEKMMQVIDEQVTMNEINNILHFVTKDQAASKQPQESKNGNSTDLDELNTQQVEESGVVEEKLSKCEFLKSASKRLLTSVQEIAEDSSQDDNVADNRPNEDLQVVPLKEDAEVVDGSDETKTLKAVETALNNEKANSCSKSDEAVDKEPSSTENIHEEILTETRSDGDKDDEQIEEVPKPANVQDQKVDDMDEDTVGIVESLPYDHSQQSEIPDLPTEETKDELDIIPGRSIDDADDAKPQEEISEVPEAKLQNGQIDESGEDSSSKIKVDKETDALQRTLPIDNSRSSNDSKTIQADSGPQRQIKPLLPAGLVSRNVVKYVSVAVNSDEGTLDSISLPCVGSTDGDVLHSENQMSQEVEFSGSSDINDASSEGQQINDQGPSGLTSETADGLAQKDRRSQICSKHGHYSDDEGVSESPGIKRRIKRCCLSAEISEIASRSLQQAVAELHGSRPDSECGFECEIVQDDKHISEEENLSKEARALVGRCLNNVITELSPKKTYSEVISRSEITKRHEAHVIHTSSSETREIKEKRYDNKGEILHIIDNIQDGVKHVIHNITEIIQDNNDKQHQKLIEQEENNVIRKKAKSSSKTSTFEISSAESSTSQQGESETKDISAPIDNTMFATGEIPQEEKDESKSLGKSNAEEETGAKEKEHSTVQETLDSQADAADEIEPDGASSQIDTVTDEKETAASMEEQSESPPSDTGPTALKKSTDVSETEQAQELSEVTEVAFSKECAPSDVTSSKKELNILTSEEDEGACVKDVPHEGSVIEEKGTLPVSAEQTETSLEESQTSALHKESLETPEKESQQVVTEECSPEKEETSEALESGEGTSKEIRPAVEASEIDTKMEETPVSERGSLSEAEKEGSISEQPVSDQALEAPDSQIDSIQEKQKHSDKQTSVASEKHSDKEGITEKERDQKEDSVIVEKEVSETFEPKEPEVSESEQAIVSEKEEIEEASEKKDQLEQESAIAQESEIVERKENELSVSDPSGDKSIPKETVAESTEKEEPEDQSVHPEKETVSSSDKAEHEASEASEPVLKKETMQDVASEKEVSSQQEGEDQAVAIAKATEDGQIDTDEVSEPPKSTADKESSASEQKEVGEEDQAAKAISTDIASTEKEAEESDETSESKEIVTADKDALLASEEGESVSVSLEEKSVPFRQKEAVDTAEAGEAKAYSDTNALDDQKHLATSDENAVEEDAPPTKESFPEKEEMVVTSKATDEEPKESEISSAPVADQQASVADREDLADGHMSETEEVLSQKEEVPSDVHDKESEDIVTEQKESEKPSDRVLDKEESPCDNVGEGSSLDAQKEEPMSSGSSKEDGEISEQKELGTSDLVLEKEPSLSSDKDDISKAEDIALDQSQLDSVKGSENYDEKKVEADTSHSVDQQETPADEHEAIQPDDGDKVESQISESKHDEVQVSEKELSEKDKSSEPSSENLLRPRKESVSLADLDGMSEEQESSLPAVEKEEPSVTSDRSAAPEDSSEKEAHSVMESLQSVASEKGEQVSEKSELVLQKEPPTVVDKDIADDITSDNETVQSAASEGGGEISVAKDVHLLEKYEGDETSSQKDPHLAKEDITSAVASEIPGHQEPEISTAYVSEQEEQAIHVIADKSAASEDSSEKEVVSHAASDKDEQKISEEVSEPNLDKEPASVATEKDDSEVAFSEKEHPSEKDEMTFVHSDKQVGEVSERNEPEEPSIHALKQCDGDERKSVDQSPIAEIEEPGETVGEAGAGDSISVEDASEKEYVGSVSKQVEEMAGDVHESPVASEKEVTDVSIDKDVPKEEPSSKDESEIKASEEGVPDVPSGVAHDKELPPSSEKGEKGEIPSVSSEKGKEEIDGQKDSEGHGAESLEQEASISVAEEDTSAAKESEKGESVTSDKKEISESKEPTNVSEKEPLVDGKDADHEPASEKDHSAKEDGHKDEISASINEQMESEGHGAESLEQETSIPVAEEDTSAAKEPLSEKGESVTSDKTEISESKEPTNVSEKEPLIDGKVADDEPTSEKDHSAKDDGHKDEISASSNEQMESEGHGAESLEQETSIPVAEEDTSAAKEPLSEKGESVTSDKTEISESKEPTNVSEKEPVIDGKVADDEPTSEKDHSAKDDGHKDEISASSNEQMESEGHGAESLEQEASIPVAEEDTSAAKEPLSEKGESITSDKTEISESKEPTNMSEKEPLVDGKDADDEPTSEKDHSAKDDGHKDEISASSNEQMESEGHGAESLEQETSIPVAEEDTSAAKEPLSEKGESVTSDKTEISESKEPTDLSNKEPLVDGKDADDEPTSEKDHSPKAEGHKDEISPPLDHEISLDQASVSIEKDETIASEKELLSEKQEHQSMTSDKEGETCVSEELKVSTSAPILDKESSIGDQKDTTDDQVLAEKDLHLQDTEVQEDASDQKAEISEPENPEVPEESDASKQEEPDETSAEKDLVSSGGLGDDKKLDHASEESSSSPIHDKKHSDITGNVPTDEIPSEKEDISDKEQMVPITGDRVSEVSELKESHEPSATSEKEVADDISLETEEVKKDEMQREGEETEKLSGLADEKETVPSSAAIAADETSSDKESVSEKLASTVNDKEVLESKAPQLSESSEKIDKEQPIDTEEKTPDEPLDKDVPSEKEEPSSTVSDRGVRETSEGKEAEVDSEKVLPSEAPSEKEAISKKEDASLTISDKEDEISEMKEPEVSPSAPSSEKVDEASSKVDFPSENEEISSIVSDKDEGKISEEKAHETSPDEDLTSATEKAPSEKEQTSLKEVSSTEKDGDEISEEKVPEGIFDEEQLITKEEVPFQREAISEMEEAPSTASDKVEIPESNEPEVPPSAPSSEKLDEASTKTDLPSEKEAASSASNKDDEISKHEKSEGSPLSQSLENADEPSSKSEREEASSVVAEKVGDEDEASTGQKETMHVDPSENELSKEEVQSAVSDEGGDTISGRKEPDAPSDLVEKEAPVTSETAASIKEISSGKEEMSSTASEKGKEISESEILPTAASLEEKSATSEKIPSDEISEKDLPSEKGLTSAVNDEVVDKISEEHEPESVSDHVDHTGPTAPVENITGDDQTSEQDLKEKKHDGLSVTNDKDIEIPRVSEFHMLPSEEEIAEKEALHEAEEPVITKKEAAHESEQEQIVTEKELHEAGEETVATEKEAVYEAEEEAVVTEKEPHEAEEKPHVAEKEALHELEEEPVVTEKETAHEDEEEPDPTEKEQLHEAEEEPVVTENQAADEADEQPDATEKETLHEAEEEPVATEKEALHEAEEEPVVTEKEEPHEAEEEPVVAEAEEEPVVTEKEEPHEAEREPVVAEKEALHEAEEEPVVAEKEALHEAETEPVVIEKEAAHEAEEEPVVAEKELQEAKEAPVIAEAEEEPVLPEKEALHEAAEESDATEKEALHEAEEEPVVAEKEELHEADEEPVVSEKEEPQEAEEEPVVIKKEALHEAEAEPVVIEKEALHEDEEAPVVAEAEEEPLTAEKESLHEAEEEPAVAEKEALHEGDEEPVVSEKEEPHEAAEEPVVIEKEAAHEAEGAPVVAEAEEEAVDAEKEALHEAAEEPDASEKEALHEAEEEPVVAEKEALHETEEEPVVSEKEGPHEAEEEPVVAEKEALHEAESEPVVVEKEAAHEAEEEPVVAEKELHEAEEEPVVAEKEALREAAENPAVAEKEALHEAESEPVVVEKEAALEAEEEPVVAEKEIHEAEEAPFVAEAEEEPVLSEKEAPHEAAEEPDATEKEALHEAEEEPVVAEKEELHEADEEPVVSEKEEPHEAAEEPVVVEKEALHEAEAEPVVIEKEAAHEAEEEPLVAEKELHEAEEEPVVAEKEALREAAEDPDATEKQALHEAEEEPAVAEKEALHEAEEEPAVSEKEALHEGDEEPVVSEKEEPHEATEEPVVIEKEAAHEAEGAPVVAEKEALHEAAEEPDASEKEALHEAEKEPVVAEKEALHETEEEPVVYEKEGPHEAEEEPAVAEKEALHEAESEPVVVEKEAAHEAEEEPVVAEKELHEAEEEPVVAEKEALREAAEDPDATEKESLHEAEEEPVVAEKEALHEAEGEPVDIEKEAAHEAEEAPVVAESEEEPDASEKEALHETEAEPVVVEKEAAHEAEEEPVVTEKELHEAEEEAVVTEKEAAHEAEVEPLAVQKEALHDAEEEPVFTEKEEPHEAEEEPVVAKKEALHEAEAEPVVAEKEAVHEASSGEDVQPASDKGDDKCIEGKESGDEELPAAAEAESTQKKEMSDTDKEGEISETIEQETLSSVPSLDEKEAVHEHPSEKDIVSREEEPSSINADEAKDAEEKELKVSSDSVCDKEPQVENEESSEKIDSSASEGMGSVTHDIEEVSLEPKQLEISPSAPSLDEEKSIENEKDDESSSVKDSKREDLPSEAMEKRDEISESTTLEKLSESNGDKVPSIDAEKDKTAEELSEKASSSSDKSVEISEEKQREESTLEQEGLDASEKDTLHESSIEKKEPLLEEKEQLSISSGKDIQEEGEEADGSQEVSDEKDETISDKEIVEEGFVKEPAALAHKVESSIISHAEELETESVEPAEAVSELASDKKETEEEERIKEPVAEMETAPSTTAGKIEETVTPEEDEGISLPDEIKEGETFCSVGESLAHKEGMPSTDVDENEITICDGKEVEASTQDVPEEEESSDKVAVEEVSELEESKQLKEHSTTSETESSAKAEPILETEDSSVGSEKVTDEIIFAAKETLTSIPRSISKKKHDKLTDEPVSGEKSPEEKAEELSGMASEMPEMKEDIADDSLISDKAVDEGTVKEESEISASVPVSDKQEDQSDANDKESAQAARAATDEYAEEEEESLTPGAKGIGEALPEDKQASISEKEETPKELDEEQKLEITPSESAISTQEATPPGKEKAGEDESSLETSVTKEEPAEETPSLDKEEAEVSGSIPDSDKREAPSSSEVETAKETAVEQACVSSDVEKPLAEDAEGGEESILEDKDHISDKEQSVTDQEAASKEEVQKTTSSEEQVSVPTKQDEAETIADAAGESMDSSIIQEEARKSYEDGSTRKDEQVPYSVGESILSSISEAIASRSLVQVIGDISTISKDIAKVVKTTSPSGSGKVEQQDDSYKQPEEAYEPGTSESQTVTQLPEENVQAEHPPGTKMESSDIGAEVDQTKGIIHDVSHLLDSVPEKSEGEKEVSQKQEMQEAVEPPVIKETRSVKLGFAPDLKVSDSVMRDAEIQISSKDVTKTHDEEIQVDSEEVFTLKQRIEELETVVTEMREVEQQHMKVACEMAERIEEYKRKEDSLRATLASIAQSDSAPSSLSSNREQSLRDELAAWKESVEQQNSVLHRLKTEMDAAQELLQKKDKEIVQLQKEMEVLQEKLTKAYENGSTSLTKTNEETQTDADEDALIKKKTAELIKLRKEGAEYKSKLLRQKEVIWEVRAFLDGTSRRLRELKGETEDRIQKEKKKEADKLLKKETQMRRLCMELDRVTFEAQENEATIEKQREEIQRLKILLSQKERNLAAKDKTIAELLKQEEADVSDQVPSKDAAMKKMDDKLASIGSTCLSQNHIQLISHQAKQLEKIQSWRQKSESLSSSDERQASIEEREKLIERLKLSERSYLELVNKVSIGLGFQGLTGNKAMLPLSVAECQFLVIDRRNDADRILDAISKLRGELIKKDKIISKQKAEVEKMRELQQSTQAYKNEVERLSVQLQAKSDRVRHLREVLKKAQFDLDEERKQRSSIRIQRADGKYSSGRARRIPLELKKIDILMVEEDVSSQKKDKPKTEPKLTRLQTSVTTVLRKSTTKSSVETTEVA